MTILITGLTHPAGQYLLDVAVAEGMAVRAIGAPGGFPQAHRRGAEIITASLEDRNALAGAVKDVDVVYHTALQAQGPQDALQRANAEGTRRVLEMCAGSIKRFVLFGTVAVYESHPTPETWPVRAEARREAHGNEQLVAYGQSMIDAEDYVVKASQLYGMEYTLLRCTTVWGRNAYATNMIRTLMRNPDRAGQINDLMGPLQWVHGIDVARAALLVGDDERARNEAFIVAGGECTTTFGLLALAWDISRPSDANPFREIAEAKQPPRRKIDTSKIEEVLEFKPVISLRQSVEEIVQSKEIPVKASRTVTARASQSANHQDEQAMRGKTCVISGATSGIGLATALKLGSMGARLVLIGRDRAKGEATLKRLRSAIPAIEASMHYCDLLRLSDIRAVAREILDTAPTIDVLINNAGSVFDRRELTVDGLERTFAVNHMAHFLLTSLLEERLVASAPARIITMSSWVHRGIAVDFDNLQSERSFAWVPAYKQAKLCNILFTRELSRRLAGKGVTANCIGPGPVATGIGDNLQGPGRAWFQRAKDTAAPPEEVAEIVAYLAGSSEVATLTGAYFENGEPIAPSSEAQDDEAARRLWTLSVRLGQLGEATRPRTPGSVRPTDMRQVSGKDSRP